MTASPDVIEAIAARSGTLTAAEKNALRTRVGARLATLQEAQSAIDDAETDANQYADELATATTAIATATTRATAQASQVTTLETQVATLQAQIADGAPPATAEDVAERDQVVALRTELNL